MSSGISCPDCGCKHSYVRNTVKLNWRGKEIIRRYRVCRHCNYSYSTKEQISEEEPQRTDLSSLNNPPPTTKRVLTPPTNPYV